VNVISSFLRDYLCALETVLHIHLKPVSISLISWLSRIIGILCASISKLLERALGTIHEMSRNANFMSMGKMDRVLPMTGMGRGITTLRHNQSQMVTGLRRSSGLFWGNSRLSTIFRNQRWYFPPRSLTSFGSLGTPR
jgi:hypothetical protein